jgi:hypothetical protein
MIAHQLAHLSDSSVERCLTECSVRERLAVAELLAYLAEFDARRLYRHHGLTSTFGFCVKILGFSEDAACKRIEVARAGRRFPAIFERIADGSLHLTGASMLSGHLTSANAGELLAAAANRSKSGIEELLAERFPRADLPTRLVPLVPLPLALAASAHAVEIPAVGAIATESQAMETPVPGPRHSEVTDASTSSLVPNQDTSPVPERMTLLVPRPRLKPLAPERFGLQATIDQATHDDLRRAQELLRHQVPDGNVPEVLKRALRLLVQTLEKRKFGLTERPRAGRLKPNSDPRRIPAYVRRAVWKRDGGRCTFVSDSGRRCEAREHVEFDHETPVARGGQATVGNIRLRCRVHNQYDAERTFGAEFVAHKRSAARELRGLRRPAPPTPRCASRSAP